MFSILQSVVLVFSILVFVSALAIQLVYVVSQKQIAKVAPARRARLLFIIVLLPAVLALVFIGLGFSPSLLTLLGFPQEHCIIHCLLNSGDHIHLCLLTPPDFIYSPSILTLFFALLMLALFNLYKILKEVINSRVLLSQFRCMSKTVDNKKYRCIDSNGMLAFSMGLFRPEVFISNGLKKQLTKEELTLVLAHECAHARRKDLLRILIMKYLSIFFLPFIARRIESDMSLACEQVCDEFAAKTVKSRLLVAQTILKLQKLVPASLQQHVMVNYFSEHHITKRIFCLLNDAPNDGFNLKHSLFYTLLISTGIYFAIKYDLAHQLLELLYNFLL